MPELFDLRTVYVILSLVAVIQVAMVMQMSAHHMIARGETETLRRARRVGLAILGFGLSWSVYYGFARAWEPWPPYLVMLLGINVLLAATIVSAYSKYGGRAARFSPDVHQP